MAETPDKNEAQLDRLREQIDALDRKIVELLNERARVVVEVGKAKLNAGYPVYAPEREHAVLQHITELSKGPLPPQSLQAIYRELMSGSFALEKPLRISYLGPEGSFSHQAAMRKFGASIEYYPMATIPAVFDEVARKRCDLGIVPIENSYGGGVVDTMDSFIDVQVAVCAEVVTEIHHNLLANCPPEQITVIASKPEVFAQCREWLSGRFKKTDFVPTSSSARAAEMAASEKGLAAIGSTLAAELNQLRIVFANIEDNPNNLTRFLVLSKSPAKRTGNDRTAMMFTVRDKPGALVSVLKAFSDRGVNLSSIHSRPSRRRNWEYYFFTEAEGHLEDVHLAEAIDNAKGHCGELHVLGSFPQSAEPL